MNRERARARTAPPRTSMSENFKKRMRESERVRRQPLIDEMFDDRRGSDLQHNYERGSPKKFEALKVKHEISSLFSEELTPEEYNNILDIFRYNLEDDNKYLEFKADLDKTLERNKVMNKELSEMYYYDKQSRLVIIFAFGQILPKLINASIPANIASFVIFILNLYNVQLMIYYYRIFIDSSNPGIQKLQSGKPFRANIGMEIFNDAIEKSKKSTFFSNIDNVGQFSPCINLMKIKKNIESFMNKQKVFMNDNKNRLRFVFLYLAIFVIMLYIAIHFDIDELKNMFTKLNTPPTPTPKSPYRQTPRSKQPLLNQTPRIVRLSSPPSGGGKKVRKSKISKKSV